MSNQSNQLLLGAFIGALASYGISKFMKSNEGIRLEKRFKEQYGEYRDKLEGFIEKLDEHFEKEVDENTKRLSKKAKESLVSLHQEITDLLESGSENSNTSILIGGALGAIAALFAGFALNSGGKNVEKQTFLNNLLDATECRCSQHRNGSCPVRSLVEVTRGAVDLWQTLRK